MRRDEPLVDFPDKTPRQRLALLLFQVSLKVAGKKELKN